MEKRIVDKQEFFSKAFIGLRNQGWKAAYSTTLEVCLYLSDDGCKCAIGHNIDPSDYNPDFEGKPGYCVLDELGYEVEENDEFFFIQELQKCHDRHAKDSDGMQMAFLKFAEYHNLQVPA